MIRSLGELHLFVLRQRLQDRSQTPRLERSFASSPTRRSGFERRLSFSLGPEFAASSGSGTIRAHPASFNCAAVSQGYDARSAHLQC